MNAALEAPGCAAGWKADLQLEFSNAGSRTVLSRRRHSGPLLVQRPFHPDADVCHCYIIHPPGGIVGGDELMLSTRVHAGAHALLTTPGATRFYRSAAGRSASLQQKLLVDGTLEWLPQETILFDGADARSSTSVELHSQSRFIAWEILCLGRPESGAPFCNGRLQLDLKVTVDASLKFLDRLRIGDPRLDPLSAPWGMRGRKALGTLLAFPGNGEAMTAIRAVTTPQVDCATSLVDGIVHCRAAAAQAEAVRAHFGAVWRVLRQCLMNRPAVAPRIWST